MPAFANQLSAEQLAAVASHIRTSWGNAFGRVSVQEVQRIRGGQQGQQGQSQQGRQTGDAQTGGAGPGTPGGAETGEAAQEARQQAQGGRQTGGAQTGRTEAGRAARPQQQAQQPGKTDSANRQQPGAAEAGGTQAAGGERVFQNSCASCHGDQGGGGVGPALAGNGSSQNTRMVVRQILNGGGGMPAFAGQLSAEQVAAVASYIRTQWGNGFDQVSVQEVRQIKGGQQQAQTQQGQQTGGNAQVPQAADTGEVGQAGPENVGEGAVGGIAGPPPPPRTEGAGVPGEHASLALRVTPGEAEVRLEGPPGLELAEAAGIISAFKIIIAVMTMRAPGMTLGRLPVFLWAMLVTAGMILFAFMTVLLASLYLELDRKFGTAFFDPELSGSPLLWQHLFWFFGHPEVYIQFLPAAGIVSMIIPAFARRPLVSYTAVVLALLGTGFLSFGLWAHHMFTVGLPQTTAGFFSAASIVIAVPTGLQFFVWIATIWWGRVVWKTPMLFVAGFIVIFLLGGLSEVMVGSAPFDWQAHDSYFVVAHFHYVLIGGVVFPLLAAFYYWMPKVSGRMMSERLGHWDFWLMFIGFNAAFFPMHIVGLFGMPRRVYTYQAGLSWDSYNLISTVGGAVFALGILLFVVNFARSQRGGEQAGPNPWGSYSLEWATTSPVGPYAFRRLPVVRSRYPLWEQDTLEAQDPEARELLDALEAWPTKWQAGVVTDLFTGRVQEVFWLPNASYQPVTLAFGLALALGALIFDLYIPTFIGLAIAVVAYVLWRRPPRHDAEHDAHYEEALRKHGVEVYLHSSPSVARWTLVLNMAIAAVTLGTFLFTFFFLGVNGGEVWPPSGVVLTGGNLALAALALVLLSTVAVAWTHRQTDTLPRGRMTAGYAVAFALGVTAGVLQVLAYLRLDFGWGDHAFGSIFYLTAAFQLFMLLSALVMNSSAQYRLGLSLRRDHRKQVQVTAGNAAVTWYVMVGTWLLTAFTLYLSPALL